MSLTFIDWSAGADPLTRGEDGCREVANCLFRTIDMPNVHTATTAFVFRTVSEHGPPRLEPLSDEGYLLHGVDVHADGHLYASDGLRRPNAKANVRAATQKPVSRRPFATAVGLRSCHAPRPVERIVRRCGVTCCTEDPRRLSRAACRLHQGVLEACYPTVCRHSVSLAPSRRR
jgi:hypothetical protein